MNYDKNIVTNQISETTLYNLIGNDYFEINKEFQFIVDMS